MADPSKKNIYSDTAPTGIAYDTHSQLPEVYESSTLPEVVPGQHPGHQGYQDPNQQYQYQQQYPPQYNDDYQDGYPHSSNPMSPAGWTSVSQQGAEAPVEAEKPGASKTILGMPRKKFWLIVGPLLAILVIGLAIGLGVGLSQRKPTSSSSSSPYPAAPTPVTCPAANGTLYTESAADGGVKFLIACNIDYNGNDASSGTTDLTSANATSAEQCMQFCGQNNECAGAWFGDFYGEKCFLKSKLGKSSPSNNNSVFVIKQTS